MSKFNQALQSVFDVVKVAKETGNVKASKELQDTRLEICKMCDRFDGSKCELCGCFMNIKVKLVAASCPDNRWIQKMMEKAMFGEMDNQLISQKCCGDS